MKIDNIDKFGNCVGCHRHLVKNVVIGGKIQGVLDADASDSFFRLNTGSILVVPICKKCIKNMDLNDKDIQDEIWKEVMNGWQLELDHMKSNPNRFPDHTPEKEELINNLYKSLNIISYEKYHKVGAV